MVATESLIGLPLHCALHAATRTTHASERALCAGSSVGAAGCRLRAGTGMAPQSPGQPRCSIVYPRLPSTWLHQHVKPCGAHCAPPPACAWVRVGTQAWPWAGPSYPFTGGRVAAAPSYRRRCGR